MCSRQTGCAVNPPYLVLDRLSNDEINHYYSPQERPVLNQSQPVLTSREKKAKLILNDKRRKKKFGLTSNVEGDTLLLSTERKSNLRSRNKLNSLHNSIKTSRKRSNCSNLKAPKKKTDNILPVSKTKSTIRNTHHSNCNASVTSKRSLKSNTKPIPIVKECMPKSTRKSACICVANKINYGVSSVKKCRLRHYRITHNMSSRMTYTTDMQIDICHSNIESHKTLVDHQENMTKEKGLFQNETFIHTTVVGEKESEDEDDEITVVGERIENAMGKILNQPIDQSIKGEKSDVKNPQFKRAHLISNLIDENKTLSIPVTEESQKSNEKCTKNINNDVPEVELQQSDKVDTNRQCGKIKLMSPESLGIEVTKDVGNDFSSKMKKYDMIKGDAKVALMGRTYLTYDTDTINKQIASLIKTLEKIILEVSDDAKLAFLFPTLSKDIEFDEKYLELILKKYSTEFIETFKLIISIFDVEVKELMIPIVHLCIIRPFKATTIITEEGVWNCILRIFEIEGFSDSFDPIFSHYKWEDARQILSITERWVISFIDLNIFSISEELINATITKFEDKKFSVSDSRPSIIEETSKDKGNLFSETSLDSNPFNNEVDPNTTNDKSDLNKDEDWNTISRLENISMINSDSSIEERNRRVNYNDIMKVELKCSNSPEKQDIDYSPNCLNQACSKKLTLPCDFCKELLACNDLCQVDEDEICLIKTIINEERITVLLSCRLHQSLVKNYPYDVVEGSMLMNTQVHKEDRRKVPQHLKNVFKKENETFVFELLQDQDLPTCLNESCSNKMSVSCYYCNEPVACPDLCQVLVDQTIKVRITDEYTTVLVSCKYHQSLIRNYIYDMESIQVEDSEMPYEPVCWQSDCERTALIVCICKTRAYCSTACQKEDWDGEHHNTCSRQSPLDLIL